MASSVRYLDVHHVSKRLKIPERTVRDRARKGRLPGVKFGPKIWYFLRAEIEALCGKTAGSEED